jgi:hypothetical protein
MARALSTKHPANPSERQALSRERLRKAGGLTISVRLSAQAADNLNAIKERIQLTTASAVEYAIERLARTL